MISQQHPSIALGQIKLLTSGEAASQQERSTSCLSILSRSCLQAAMLHPGSGSLPRGSVSTASVLHKAGPTAQRSRGPEPTPPTHPTPLSNTSPNSPRALFVTGTSLAYAWFRNRCGSFQHLVPNQAPVLPAFQRALPPWVVKQSPPSRVCLTCHRPDDFGNQGWLS